MVLAREANFSVDMVSSENREEEVMVQMMAVRALPPREGWRIRVNLESRYGICTLRATSEPSAARQVRLRVVRRKRKKRQ
jgi:hypothetical protein